MKKFPPRNDSYLWIELLQAKQYQDLAGTLREWCSDSYIA